MNFGKQIVWLALLIAVLLLSRLAFQAAPQLATAQPNEKSALIKWEYCAISQAGADQEFGKSVGWVTIQYFQLAGTKEEKIEFTSDLRRDYFDLKKGARAKALAKLGEEGWEMIAKEPDREKHDVEVFYLKRPKP